MTTEEALTNINMILTRQTFCTLEETETMALYKATEALQAMYDYEWLKRLSNPKRIKQKQHCDATYMICPHCHTSFGEKYKTKARNFCEDCGQRLDWSDDDDKD